MPNLVPMQSITVIRDGKPVIPKIGVPFDFTDKEVASVAERSPGALRKPVNEESVAVAAEVEAPKAKTTKKADPEL